MCVGEGGDTFANYLKLMELSKGTTDVITNDVVEAHCYVVDIGRTDHEQIRSRINNNWKHKTVRSWQRPTWPKRPASVVIDSATYLLTISSPDVITNAIVVYL